MKVYQVWIHVEAVDEEEDEYSEPVEPEKAATCSSLQTATLIQDSLVDVARELVTNYPETAL